MLARKVRCLITEKLWLTPSVMKIRFEPSKKFSFHPGQFLSLIVPAKDGRSKPIRRAYSFAMPPDEKIYELCVKYVRGGPGSEFLAAMKVGDSFDATAPYGDLFYETKPGRSACFISTGTGIAPFRSMIASNAFQESPPDKAFVLFGTSSEEEIIYPGFFEQYGVETIVALSKPSQNWTGFHGRVTDFLRQMSTDWSWHSTDFYLCGNGGMVAEVRKILRGGHGVPNEKIFQEVYFVSGTHSEPVTLNPGVKAA